MKRLYLLACRGCYGPASHASSWTWPNTDTWPDT